jgi:magnesium transporter
MNFENMPELTTRFGYFAILGLMAALTTFLAYKFKKAHWL